MRHIPWLFLLLLLQCSSSRPQLKPFTSDGCSLFPDKDWFSDASWCECCVRHDVAYWKGGSDGERKNADRELGECVLTKTGDTTFAKMVYMGVRSGGSEVFPNWYRWGYGWPYGAKVSSQERAREVRRYEMIKMNEVLPRICRE